MAKSVRKNDVVIRYGGDEFMMVFFDITKDVLERKLSQLTSAVKKVKLDDHPEVQLTMSLGGAYGTDLVNNLIATADKALYESKKTRDTYTVIEV